MIFKFTNAFGLSSLLILFICGIVFIAISMYSNNNLSKTQYHRYGDIVVEINFNNIRGGTYIDYFVMDKNGGKCHGAGRVIITYFLNDEQISVQTSHANVVTGRSIGLPRYYLINIGHEALIYDLEQKIDIVKHETVNQIMRDNHWNVTNKTSAAQ